MAKTILISGASSGFGSLAAFQLADAGHTVYAGMRDIEGHNAEHAEQARSYTAKKGGTVVPIELDVSSDTSAHDAVATVIDEHGRLDVMMHNAGHMVTGPSEAFTTEQLAALYDTNVLGTQRINRALLPHMRERRDGLMVWIGSSSTRGGTPPYLGPYFAAKAGMDALAASYALEVSRFGIETTIVVPGSFTSGTGHFAHGGHPADESVAKDYNEVFPNLMDQVRDRLAGLEPPGADVAEVARAIVRVVDMKKGTRPFRVHVDPSDDGATAVNGVADRIRADFLIRIGLDDLLHPVAS